MTKKIRIIDKEAIRNRGLDAIQEYFGVPIEKLDNKTLTHLHQRARIGLLFEKEMNLNNRTIEINYLRVFKMVAKDKEELKKYIKKTLPKYDI